MRIPATACPLLRRFGCTLLFCGFATAMVDAQFNTRPGTRDAAALSFSALSVAEDNGGIDGAVVVQDPQYPDVQIYSVLSAAIVLAPQQEKFQWQVSASTGVRHYLSQHEFTPSGQVVSASLSFPLGGRTNVSMSETAAYSPTYALAPFLPGAQFGVGASATALDYGAVRSPNFSTFTSLSLARSLTARATVTVGYALNRMAFTNQVDPNLSSSNASARFTYRISRDASFRAGYGRRMGQYLFGAEDARVDDYDIGVDYNRALSLRPSRQTTVNFSTGSSFYRDVGGRHYAFTGSANLAHRFGRTNEVGLSYARNFTFLQGLLTPVFTDTVTASTTSMLSPRLRLTSSAGYVFGDLLHYGDSNLAQTQSSYGAWTATGQFSVALTRRVTLETGYTYYEHRVGDAVQLIGNMRARLHRQMLFAGLSVGVPLISERSGTRR